MDFRSFVLIVGTALAISCAPPAATGAGAGPALLFEPATGEVLFAEEVDRPWHPASVTKMMTAYLVFEAVKAGSLAWDSEVPLSEHARAQPATRIGLRGGIKLNVEQAVRGLILRSANDFATALAERVSGSEPAFVLAMNEAASRLGMQHTRFRNPHGLPDPEQVTTARDLARLTAALVRDFPERAEVFATPTVRIHKGTFHSQNDLLRTLEGADGMKTGFTCASGYNVVASATREGRQLVAVVLGAVNRQKRSERAAELLEAGFAHLRGRGAVAGAMASPERPPTAGAPAALPARPIEIRPVALAALPVLAPEAHVAHDMGREVRSGKCRGYAGWPKPGTAPATSEAEAEEAQEAIVTGSVAPASAAPEPATGAATAPPAATPLRAAAAAATTGASRIPANPKSTGGRAKGAKKARARPDASAAATSGTAAPQAEAAGQRTGDQ